MGRSEHANTLVVDKDLNVLRTVGWVPRVTFFLSLSAPEVRKKMFYSLILKALAIIGTFQYLYCNIVEVKSG